MGRVKDLAIERDSYDFYEVDKDSVSISSAFLKITPSKNVIINGGAWIDQHGVVTFTEGSSSTMTIEIEDKLNYDFIKALKEL